MRPVIGDYDEYYQQYIDLVEGDNILNTLEVNNHYAQNIFNTFPQSKGDYCYAEGKWTIKEVIGHMMDTERIYCYRALSIARGEKNPLPGFDQDLYVVNGKFNDRPLYDLTYEYRFVREATINLFHGFSQSVLQNKGNANGNDVTVLALMFIIAGHEKHHLNVLKERYM
ncbi:MAG: DinB family protein [Ignavibacteriaceae bacterium]